MYAYEFDEQTGGLLLTSSILTFSKEPRPVYYQELDVLGFDRYWTYEKNDCYPFMWAEANNYFYRGRKVAKTKGGSCYTAPEITILEDPEPNGQPLRFVDIPAMVEKNKGILDGLVKDTIKSVYNTYIKYKKKVNIFYVAFSGGKDSVVTLDIVRRSLPSNAFMVLFGDTGMEFPDTYLAIDEVQKFCEDHGLNFYRAKSKYSPAETWQYFGPPSTTNRWCCNVHKTAPQIIALREITGIHDFTGMAFTGVRASESLTRSEYDVVSQGSKHQGQFGFHTILDWNSAEVFLYIYSNDLVLNGAYKKGHVRAGCLVCPNSTGKHEYIKRSSYTDGVDFYLNKIVATSGKSNYSESEMKEFIDAGFWRTRKSGRELNFGQDKFEIKRENYNPVITVYTKTLEWIQWAKTIGTVTQKSDSDFSIYFAGKLYGIHIERHQDSIEFKLVNCENDRNDIKFQSLFKSVVIKSLYCVGCGVCEAECKNNCIDMKDGIHISDNCIHCYKCHNIYEHCLRYNSIRNKIAEGKKMEKIDRYLGFGVRSQWLDIYAKYEGSSEFWDTDGEGQVPNKKKDVFLNFLRDSGMVEPIGKNSGNKFAKYLPTEFAKVIFNLGSDSSVSWALILVNLSYTSEFNWFVHQLIPGSEYTPESLKNMLSDVMQNDVKGHGKDNVVDALKIFLSQTPLGTDKIFAVADVTEKIIGSGVRITLNNLRRVSWQNPDPRVVLYSLYKFAEGCGGYYKFTLNRLLNHNIDSEGISPTEIFGLERDQMEKILTGLSVNYPEFINASFTLDLDNITLRSEKAPQDVLQLF